MDLIVSGGEARWGGRRWPCAIGPAGIAAEKREGDGATPAGRFAIRRLLYRPDRLPPPLTGLSLLPLSPLDGWCDDPKHPDYNRRVRLPHPASCEKMWRDDACYDLVIPLGYNDDPVVPGKGSAIFLHVARPDYSPTGGCIAIAKPDLLAMLATAGPGDCVAVET